MMGMGTSDALAALMDLPTADDAAGGAADDVADGAADGGAGGGARVGLVERIRAMDRDMFAVELSVGVEEVMERLFDAGGVDDTLAEAHTLSFADYEGSLRQHYSEALSDGPASMAGLFDGLRGKVADLKAESILEGYFPGQSFEISSDAARGVWDLQGFGPAGAQGAVVQVREGARAYAPDAAEGMESAPGALVSAGRQVYDAAHQTAAAGGMAAGGAADLGASNLDMTADIAEDVGMLGASAGFDSPAAIGEILPYVGEIVIGIKLVVDMVSTERDFKDVALNDRSRVHALKALVLMSKFGVTTVCAAAGSMAGGSAGTLALPGVGTAAGGIIGGVGGAALAAALNRRLRNRTLELAMHLSGVDEDEFFYLRNKLAADGIGASLAGTRGA